MDELGHNEFRHVFLSNAARALDSKGFYHIQFDYLYNQNKDIIGQEPKGELYKEWLNIIVQDGPVNAKNFDAITFRAFDTLLRRRITEEEYLLKRPDGKLPESRPAAVQKLEGKSWVALAEQESQAKEAKKSKPASRLS